MVSREYVGDFEVREEYNPRTGKTKTVTEYVGPWYRFTHAEDMKRVKRLYILLSLCILASVSCMLGINAICGHIWYSMAPIVFMFIPAMYLVGAMIRLITAKDKVIREHRDKVVERYRKVSLWFVVLGALALSGHIAFSIIWGDELKDLLFYLFTAAVIACGLLLYLKRDLISMTEVEE